MLKRFIKYCLIVMVLVAGGITSAYALSFADYVYQSVRRGNTSNIRAYLAKGYSINATNSQGMTALCQAVEDENYVAYNRLRQLGSSVKSDCMQRVDEKTAARFEERYLQSAPVSTGSTTAISGDTATYTALGLLAAGAVTAGVIAAQDGSSHHHRGPTKCKEGEKLVDGKCEPIICPEGTHLVGDECEELICPEGQIIVGNYCSEVTCPVGQVMENGVCKDIKCPEGQILKGNVCVGICAEGSHWNGEACVLDICPNGTHLVGNSCEPNDTCPEGKKWDEESKMCVDIVCPKGMHVFGDGCIADDAVCPAGKVWDSAENACVDIMCPTGMHMVEDKCIRDGSECSTGQVWDVDTKACIDIVCPEGMHMFEGKCVTDDSECPEGQVWNVDEGACVDIVCPAGMHIHDNECITDDSACRVGQIWSPEKEDCVDIECPTGTYMSEGKCVMDDSCPIGQYKNGDGECVPIECPTNTHLVGNLCVADDLNVENNNNNNVYGIASDDSAVFNLYSSPKFPDKEAAVIINNNGNGDVYGVYGYGGETFNAYVIGRDWYSKDVQTYNKEPVGTGSITIIDKGKGTVYGMYSHIADITQYKESINASGWDLGTAYGNININHTGGGATYGLMGDVRVYNTYTSGGGSAIGNVTIRGDGDIYGIYGYVAAVNGLNVWIGNYSRGEININSIGNGDVYGMAISKDDIPGAGAGGGGTASWWAFNSYAGGGSVIGNINIHNTGNGNVYGMYGGQQLYNAMTYGGYSEGNINVTNLGKGEAYGMYMPEADDKGLVANVSGDRVQSNINLVNIGDGIMTGMRGGRGVTIINSGEININNISDGTAVGIYGEMSSLVKNSGIINIYRSAYHDDVDGEDYVPESVVGGTAYGIYAEVGAGVQNSGTITITGAGDGAGIYLEKGASLINTGTVKFNGGDGRIVENGAPKNIYGDKAGLAQVNLSSLGEGEVVLGTGGQFFADSLSGNMAVAAESVQGSFKDEYNLPKALQADTTDLNLLSKSAMFEAKKKLNQDSGYDVVMERKPFSSLLNNNNTAEFLEKNYALGNNLELYDNLKSIQNNKEFKAAVSDYTGNAVLPSFRLEDATVYRHLSKQFNDNLFDRPDENYMGGYKYVDISREKDGDLVGNDGSAHSAYGLLKRKSNSGLTYGLGATVSQIKTDYDNNSSRKSNTFGLWAPVGYNFDNGTKWFSKLYAGYEDGSYDRTTRLRKYSADLEAYQYGLSNEVRHDMLLGDSGIKITPVAELNFLGSYLDGFDEGSARGAIHADSTNMLSLEGGLGAYLSKEFNINQDNKLGVKIGGVYYVEFLDPDDGIDVTQVEMVGKHKVAHKSSSNRSVLSARVDYAYKNFLFYGELEKELGDNDAVVIDAGMQYNFK